MNSVSLPLHFVLSLLLLSLFFLLYGWRLKMYPLRNQSLSLAKSQKVTETRRGRRGGSKINRERKAFHVDLVWLPGTGGGGSIERWPCSKKTGTLGEGSWRPQTAAQLASPQKKRAHAWLGENVSVSMWWAMLRLKPLLKQQPFLFLCVNSSHNSTLAWLFSYHISFRVIVVYLFVLLPFRISPQSWCVLLFSPPFWAFQT